MSAPEEKTRSSGESPREQGAPILPVVNPEAEKAQPPKSMGIHPAFYVM
jgi:hypothetical protein